MVYRLHGSIRFYSILEDDAQLDRVPPETFVAIRVDLASVHPGQLDSGVRTICQRSYDRLTVLESNNSKLEIALLCCWWLLVLAFNALIEPASEFLLPRPGFTCFPKPKRIHFPAPTTLAFSIASPLPEPYSPLENFYDYIIFSSRRLPFVFA